MIGPHKCHCCGQEESTSGCVRGLRCHCDEIAACALCTKCTNHHHRNCTEGLRVRVEQLRNEFESGIHALREENEINIFDYGEVKEITGWFRTTPSGDVVDG